MPKKSLTSLLASLMLSYCMKVDMSYRVCSSACRSSPQSTNCSSTQDRFGLRGGSSGSDSLSVMGRGGSHNGDTLSDLLGMHCGRQRGCFDLGAYAHRSVPCLKTDLLFDFVLPKPSKDLYLFSGKKNQINKS